MTSSLAAEAAIPSSDAIETQTLGQLEARLAESPAEIRAAQELRYRIFYEEMAAEASPAIKAAKRDFDKYDDVCDHLLVFDRRLGKGVEAIVATYRLIRKPAAQKAGGFYTANEYDISKIEKFPGTLLELGRSCVAEPYRNRPTMQLLWRGIAAYVFHHKIELMFGCASFPGIDAAQYAEELSYLHHYHLAPDYLRPRCLDPHYLSMDMIPKEAIDPKRALLKLPPLVKGYLRLGGFFGDGAYVDKPFGTVDVCVMVKTDEVTDKYFKYYERTAVMGGEE